jgi:hypothetical protein
MTSLVNLHSELSSSSYYMGSANVSSNVVWVRDSRGHIVVEMASKKEFVRVVLGHVDPQRLNCGPEGKYQSRNQSTGEGKISIPTVPTF